MRALSYGDALAEATRQEMERDPSVFVYGISVPDHKNVFVCKSLTSLGVGRLMASRLNAYQYPFLGQGAMLDSSHVTREDIKVRLVSPQHLKELTISHEFGQHVALALMVMADWMVGTSLITTETNTARSSPL